MEKSRTLDIFPALFLDIWDRLRIGEKAFAAKIHVLLDIFFISIGGTQVSRSWEKQQ